MAKTDIKITKQDLERDEVLEFTDHLIFFLRSHGQKIVIAVALFFIAWSIVILMNNRKEGTLRAASDQLFVALTTYERALSDTEFGSEERVAAMAGVAELADKVRSQFPDTEVSRTALFLKGNPKIPATIPAASASASVSLSSAWSSLAKILGAGGGVPPPHDDVRQDPGASIRCGDLVQRGCCHVDAGICLCGPPGGEPFG